MQALPVFIGYDPREHAAYDVAKFSIERRASRPVLISPLNLRHLGHTMHRRVEQHGSQLWCPISQAPMATEFAISRFCVPFIQREGWALFMDCDMLCLADVAELFALADDRYAVMVVKHQQEGGGTVKMDGQAQTYYSRKNWSSVMLVNCGSPAHSRLLQRDLNGLPGRDLHAFKWLRDDEIGELPAEWNHLVGIDSGAASMFHFTLGTPDMPGYEGCDYADLWFNEKRLLDSVRKPSEPPAAPSPRVS